MVQIRSLNNIEDAKVSIGYPFNKPRLLIGPCNLDDKYIYLKLFLGTGKIHFHIIYMLSIDKIIVFMYTYFHPIYNPELYSAEKIIAVDAKVEDSP
jgi:hypothetical protein